MQTLVIHKAPRQCGFIIMLIVALIVLLNDVIPSVAVVSAINPEEESILQNYRTLGMDESVKLVKNDESQSIPRSGQPQYRSSSTLMMASPAPSLSALLTTKAPEFPVDQPIEADELSSEISDSSAHQLPTDKPIQRIIQNIGRGDAPSPAVTLGESIEPPSDRVNPYNYSRGLKDSQQLWLVPPREGPQLTKLITANEAPTFLEPKLVKPNMNITDNTGGRRKKLAQYTIIVPIWIPAVKPHRNRMLVTKSEPVKYVKETHTEMVPMRKNVAIKKTIVKPERVRQKIVTDYVRAPDGKISPSVDDSVKPDEELLGSVVSNFQ